jgi:hypothetical protein
MIVVLSIKVPKKKPNLMGLNLCEGENEKIKADCLKQNLTTFFKNQQLFLCNPYKSIFGSVHY